MAETKDKAQLQLQSMNVGQEFKDVLANLIKIMDATEELMRSGQGQSADVRVLKSKFDQTKSELFQTNKKLEQIKKDVFTLISEEVLNMSKELKVLQKSINPSAETPKQFSSLQNSLKNLVNKAAELSKM